MECSQAARFVSLTGGFLARQKYDTIDLSIYDSRIGTAWGSRGIPQAVINQCKEHKIETVTTVTTIEQARDLLANGYALSVCSDYGFSSVRDKYGIADPRGSWSHAMAWIGCDDTHERLNETLFLVQNSWGVWNSGPKYYEQPDGSFWIRQSVAERMIASGAAFAYSRFKGFVRKMDWTRIKEVYA
jgi:C1A family cysteine protease